MLTLQKTEGQATCSLSTLAPEASLNEGERKNRQQKKSKKFNKKNEDKGHHMREYSEHESKVAEGMDGGWQNQLEHDSMVKLYKNSIVTPSYHDTQFATQLTML